MNIQKILISFALIFSLFTSFGIAYGQTTCASVAADAECAPGCIKIGAPAPGQPNCLPQETAFPQYISMIYTLSITLAIILAVIMVIYGGYKYMTSAGNPETLAEAKDIITGAIVGLVLLILAALLLHTIDPNILGFS